MKLFQIEEPDGAIGEAEGPGAAVGIDIDARSGGAVAVALGGNAEILPGDDGARRLEAAGAIHADGRFDETALVALLLGLRARAERQLARPVTHAVIAARTGDDAVLARAAAAAGLGLLRLIERDAAARRAGTAAPMDAAALGAALEAEDLAPPPA
jgi:hypothetical protein